MTGALDANPKDSSKEYEADHSTNDDGDIKHAQITPLQTISKQALESALKIATQFGLTPSARTKISAPKLEIKDNEFNFFND